jgi:hypothetical protein
MTLKRTLIPLFVFGLSSLLLLAVLAAAPKSQDTAAASQAPKPTQTQQLASARQLYELHCTVCHGDTGDGLEEARLAFPEDHRRCESCHKPGNPDLQAEMPDSFELMRGRVAVGNAFAIGEAPSLTGEGTLSAFDDAAGLEGYIRTAMPRYAPGTLAEKESLALTALILKWNRALPEGAVLTRENADEFRF